MESQEMQGNSRKGFNGHCMDWKGGDTEEYHLFDWMTTWVDEMRGKHTSGCLEEGAAASQNRFVLPAPSVAERGEEGGR